MSTTYTKLLYHFVFSTKMRLPLITAAIQDELYRYIGGIVVGEGAALYEIGGMPDHVHLLVQLKPTVSLSDFLRQLKSNSSKWLNERTQTPYKFAWQEGYSAFTVSESQVSRVRAYIQDQAEHHRASDFQSELRELLSRHGIEFDEQFLWD